ncbi:hypothetical protein CR205_11935 [Alteribacter lacisalsi]|uniref:DUF1761 domain-containing protein n=1 Tax=Alteribacter lacisalsi TaxID=2045244 RepID=A0A2W0H6S1_9BACI|nr:DUF1761 domain-containing protein [Alteribacter lacisalsi]PYZ96426.1 hypothetical protein CR205_11935 [Alteribacter lacisalsi]
MILPILAGTVLYIAVGMLYYSPLLFGNRWVDVLKINTKEHPPNFPMVTLVTLFTAAALYGILTLAGAETAGAGALYGLLTGIVVVLAYAKDFLFGLGHATKSAVYTFVVAAGYHLIALTLIGTIMTIL